MAAVFAFVAAAVALVVAAFASFVAVMAFAVAVLAFDVAASAFSLAVLALEAAVLAALVAARALDDLREHVLVSRLDGPEAHLHAGLYTVYDLATDRVQTWSRLSANASSDIFFFF